MAKAKKAKSKQAGAKPSGAAKPNGKKTSAAHAAGTAVTAPAAVAAPMIDIGISGGDRKRIAEGLSHYLADAYSLYLKTHNFHWNVTGPMFNSLHLMFQTQYTEQWNALDEVAERIRALGFVAPGSYEEFARLSSHASEAKLTDHTQWREMVRQLVVGNETLCRTGRKVLGVADKASDDPTVDLMTRRLEIHEKYAWMLRSLLQ